MHLPCGFRTALKVTKVLAWGSDSDYPRELGVKVLVTL
jgi:hypothetical protein